MVENGAVGGSSGRASPGRLVTGLAVAAITVGVLALVEGMTGLALLGWDLAREKRPGLTSRLHSDQDTLLGWINRPGYRNPDMYGRGVALVINSRSMRDDEEVADAEPGVLRIVCSGDSFTFGVDVGGADTWCSKLEGYDSRIRTLNLGHPGYGIDQAYLHYRRDGESLEHAVHVFAFIPDDVRRIRLARFAGYDKPYFDQVDGEPVLRQVPVPHMSAFGVAVQRRRERLRELHIVQFGNRLSSRLRGWRQPDRVNSEAEARQIAIALMDSTAASARRNGRIVLFVLLEQTLARNSQNDELAGVLRAELARRNLDFLDFRSEARMLVADSLDAMFERSASGHYSARGHERLAHAIWRVLSGRPDFMDRLNALPAR